VGVPETSETGLEDCAEGSCIDAHRGDEGLVFMVFVETLPWCPKLRVGEKVWTSEVLSTRTPVFDGPRMILIRTDDQNRGEDPHLIPDLIFVLNFKPMLREEVMEEEEVVVHGGGWFARSMAGALAYYNTLYSMKVLRAAAGYCSINLG